MRSKTMSIETIIATRDALIKDIDKGLRSAKPQAGDLQRPIALQESHVASINDRIAALESLRKQQNERIDSDIEALKADLKAAKQRLEADRKTLSDSTNPQRPTGGTRIPVKSAKTTRRAPAGKK
jgi:predicted  nucleic acid-binding Zn-ribbon protein